MYIEDIKSERDFAKENCGKSCKDFDGEEQLTYDTVDYPPKRTVEKFKVAYCTKSKSCSWKAQGYIGFSHNGIHLGGQAFFKSGIPDDNEELCTGCSDTSYSNYVTRKIKAKRKK